MSEILKSDYYSEPEVSLGLNEKELETARGQIFRYAKSMLGMHPNSSIEAEDIVQETLARAHFNYQSFRKDSSLETWLYKIAENVIRDFHRKNNARTKKDRNILRSEDLSNPKIDEEISNNNILHNNNSIETNLSDKVITEKLLATLSEDQRKLLIEKEIQGHSLEEIAEKTGEKVNTLKVKLFRIRQKLQKKATRHRLI